MSDIVERLRTQDEIYEHKYVGMWSVDENKIEPLCVEAADTIEALRAENDAYRQECSNLKNELAKWVNYWRDKDIKVLRANNARLRKALEDLIEDHEYMTDTGPDEDNLARAYARKALEVSDEQLQLL